MKKKIIFIIIILLISMVISLITQVFVWPYLSKQAFLAKYQLSNVDEKTIIINKTEKITVKENFSLAKITEKVSPAVVKIYFLDKNIKNNKSVRTHAENSSGVILSSDGVIATILPDFDLKNKMIKIFLSDGRESLATIKKEDFFNEILILKIEEDNLPVAPFGESNNLKNGEKLVLTSKSIEDDRMIFSLRAIKKYSNSFSKKDLGFLFSDENTEVFILDGMIDKEFIGSPVVDFNGTIVGLSNVATSGKINKSFVIPFSNVKKSIDNITLDSNQGKNNQRKLFGVYYLNIDKNLQLLNKLDSEEGALIYSPSGKTGLAVRVNSIGRKAGLKIYDIITQINNVKIDKDNTLSKVIQKQDLNKDMKIKIIRKGKDLELSTK